jgi:hypothetical protein
MTSGLLSTFSTTYGIAADHFIDAEFVSRDGSIFSLNDINSPNLFSFRNTLFEPDAFAACVSVSVKLHPVTNDEEGILVPFNSLDKAIDFARDCAVRHIGLAIAILGGEFISTFLSPTSKRAAATKDIFLQKLDIPYLVLLIGDQYALRTVSAMGYPVIDQKLFQILYQGLPSLESAKWLELLDELADDEPYAYLKLNHFYELAETALAPSPSQITQDIDPELQPFFEKLYARPEMTDLLWLNTFRIQSSRYCREKPCVAFACYLPMDDSLIAEIQDWLHIIADQHQLKSEFGFITPLDNGKRCFWEYDYYFNNNDPDDILRIGQAAGDAGALLDAYSERTGTIRQVRYVVNQGCCRKENLLYAK